MEVKVDVPNERLADFYVWFGRWLGGELASALGAAGQAVDDWSGEDVREAVQVYRKLSPTARKLFDLLMDDPERKFSGDDIAEALNLPNGKHAVAGTLAWPGRHSYKVGRRMPIEWQEPSSEGDVSLYWMSMDCASLFQVARKEVMASEAA